MPKRNGKFAVNFTKETMSSSFAFFDVVQNYLRQHHVVQAGLFGSFARGEQNEHSDIDLAIEKEGMTIFELLQMEEDLEKLTQRKIDIVEFRAIKPSIKPYIIKDLIRLV
ncbi:MAG: nucleotidyltransferase family protein [Bacteroidetes bacterium]|nr:nucleotidyltransferase family protein [Bacteroidota bacterium]